MQSVTVTERRRKETKEEIIRLKVEYAASAPPSDKSAPALAPALPSSPSSPSKQYIDDFALPTYTMAQIHAAIPAHCLIPSTKTTLFYFSRDILMISALLLTGLLLHPSIPASLYAQIPFFALYSFIQGLLLTGFWELAHECGHGALFKEKWMNHYMGMFIHSFLLVPYHSWRFTHSTHHKVTNNLDKDIAFIPRTRPEIDAWYPPKAAGEEETAWEKLWDLVEDMPIFAAIHLFFHQLVAWPIYLCINNFALERMARYPWWTRSHFYFGNSGPLFTARQLKEVIISDVGIASMAAVLWGAEKIWGREKVVLWYLLPWLWTNHWILTITYLQHTSPTTPFYSPSTWTFLRGAACTIDRDSGWLGRYCFHGAIETHVVHHHNSRIPFYHAVEATQAVRKVMGTHYQSAGNGFGDYWRSAWETRRRCDVVEEKRSVGGVWFFEGRK